MTQDETHDVEAAGGEDGVAVTVIRPRRDENKLGESEYPAE